MIKDLLHNSKRIVAGLIRILRYCRSSVLCLVKKDYVTSLEAVSLHSAKSMVLPKDYTVIQTARDIIVPVPKVVGSTPAMHEENLLAVLPESYMVNLHNVRVIGGTHLVKISDWCGIYDEVALREDRKRYAIRTNVISLDATGCKAAVATRGRKRKINRGIHLLHDVSWNYFHWIVECLPRLLLIDQYPEYDDWPILVDKRLARQFFEALELINTKKRPLVLINPEHEILVKELVFASGQSVILDNYDQIPDPSRDAIIDPESIRLLRSRICARVGTNSKSPRKIYFSRSEATYRRLRNEHLVQDFLKNIGFEVIYPGHMSFVEQVALMSQAEVLVSPAGGSLTNMIFAPSGCKVLSLCSNHARNNLYFFAAIAHALGLEFKQVICPEHPETHIRPVHNDFSCDLEILKKALYEP